MYLLLNAQAFKVLQDEVHNGGGTKWWGTKYFNRSSNLRNIVVVPYLDKDHWSIYIYEEKQCIYYESIPRFHNDATSKEFAHNVCIVWTLSRGLNEDDANFATFCECQYHCSQGICSKEFMGMWPPSCAELLNLSIGARDISFITL